MRDITAVLGVYNNLDTTKAFMEDFIRRFPDIPISVSCVGSSQEVQDECKRLYGEKVITGTTERVSFSETWNYAIRGIKTSKFVFIHNDMYIVDDFFDQLEGYYLDSPKNFYVYTTVEPLKNVGFPRPGKVVANFGETVDTFRKEKFLEFVKYYKESHRLRGRGYGFYLAGFTESLKDVGGFDFKTFFPVFCEDDDLLVRIRKKGYALYTAPSAIVYHFGSKTAREVGTKGMSNSEIEMNRRFARKWGFEARYLWETGYEFEDSPLETGTEKIGYRVGSETEVPLGEILNVEPLVDVLDISSTIPAFLEYFKKYNVEEKLKGIEDCDILITQVGSGNFNVFTHLIGELRFKYKLLEPGVQRCGNYLVEIRRVHRDQNRQDPRNYLFLQN